jgi:VanZ family protein
MTTPGPLKIEWKAGRAWLLVLIWTGVVLWFGGDHASADTTSDFIGRFVRWLLPDATPAVLDRIHFFIRKSAHVGEYGVLALLVLLALLASTRAAALRLALLALAWVLAVAACDETRQAASLARTGSAWDVALDLSGGILALAFALAYLRLTHSGRTALERG